MDVKMPLKTHDDNVPDSTVKHPGPSKLPTPLVKRPGVARDSKMKVVETKRVRLDLSNVSDQGNNHPVVRPPKNPRGNLRRSMSLNNVNCNGVTKNHRAAPPRKPLPKSKVLSGSTSGVAQRTTSMNSICKQQATAPSIKSAPAPGKRAGWDLKGRLEDTEHTVQAMSSRLTLLENNNNQLQAQVISTNQEANEFRFEVERLTTALREKETKLTELEVTHTALDCQYKDAKHRLDCSESMCKSYELTIAQLTGAQAGITAQLNAAKVQMECDMARIAQLVQMIAERDATITHLRRELAVMEVKVRTDESERRRLHNVIQELKGNIRVFCRVRPLLSAEAAAHSRPALISYPGADQQVLELCHSDNSKSRAASKYEFRFDRVFAPQVTQDAVFAEISQLIQSALDGYNVCVFAYGQTGSGKTYTMEGPESCIVEQAGMIPRAVDQIFRSIELLQCRGWQYDMEATFLEVYNETIRDLLGSDKDDVKHEIKMTDAKGGDVYVSNVTHVHIKSEDQVFKLLIKARERRAVAATCCNDRSSRSHSIFQLRLTGCNESTGESCQGTLNLVDLAGSERLKESQSEGQRLREAKNINKSLSNLGNVIMALAQKADHVPFRTSKLTHLLMSSLGGNSKTLMFVNVSPKEEHLNETLNSLRFATKVNQCQIGTAQRKTK